MSNCWHFARRQLENPAAGIYLLFMWGRGFAIVGDQVEYLSFARQVPPLQRQPSRRDLHPAFLLRDPRAKHQVWKT
jgi:hypothetical protein